jgi:hypothetical protein
LPDSDGKKSRNLLSEVSVEAETVEPVVVHATNWGMRDYLEYLRYARGVPQVQLEVDYHRLFIVPAVLAARVVSRADR